MPPRRTWRREQSAVLTGLDVALRVLRRVEDIGMCELTSSDVVRHPLVQKIVKAYEDYESIQEKKKKRQAGRK